MVGVDNLYGEVSFRSKKEFQQHSIPKLKKPPPTIVFNDTSFIAYKSSNISTFIDNLVFFVTKTKGGWWIVLLPLLFFLTLAIGSTLFTLHERTIVAIDRLNVIENHGQFCSSLLGVHTEKSATVLLSIRNLVLLDPSSTELVPKFQEFLGQHIIEDSKLLVDAVFLAPMGIVSAAIPYTPNRKAIGHDLFASAQPDALIDGEVYSWPSRRSISLSTVDRREPTLSDPVDLVQGGRAIIGRLAVFIKNVTRNDTFGYSRDLTECSQRSDWCYNETTNEKVWGFVNIVISWQELIKPCVDLLQSKHYRYRLESKQTGGTMKTIMISPDGDIVDGIVGRSVPINTFNWQWRLTIQTSTKQEIYPIFFFWVIPLSIVIIFLFSWILVILNLRTKQNSFYLESILPPQAIYALRHGVDLSESFTDVSVLFTDIVGFTDLSQTISPLLLAEFLNELYEGFDKLAEKNHVFKVETIGDAFVATCGCPVRGVSPVTNAVNLSNMALDMISFCANFESKGGIVVEIRAGINTGPLVGTVMGNKCPRYCIVGDTVNTASRMESNSAPGRLHCSSSTFDLLQTRPDLFHLASRGEIEVKGKGIMHTYWVDHIAALERIAKISLDKDVTDVLVAVC
jgi:class 3 adenylate cyclase